MNKKLLNLALLLSSLIGYLEWGRDSKSFLGQTELDVLSKLFQDPASVMHPFIILPLLGQILLLLTLFQKQPSKLLSYTGMGCIAILLVLMLFIGIISLNVKILLSVLPFLTLSIFVWRAHRSLKNTSNNEAV